MTSTYLKKIFPMTWKRAYTPPVPPTQYYEITFDTSSQYITNTITPFDVEEGTEALYISTNPNIVTIDSTDYTMVLADEWTSITGWSANNTAMVSGTAISIEEDTEFMPTVVHQIIHRDTQGPCPNGWHIGTKDEWQTLITALTTLGAYNVSNITTYLKIPSAYYLARSSGAKETRYGICRYWTSTMTSNTVAWAWGIDETPKFVFQEDKPGNAFSIRPFKDNPVAPDSTWTLMTTGIYWNATLGMISIQNGSSWITISDKNLGATDVGDNGLFYQFGSNSGYTYNATPYVTTKPTISADYGPGNYYTGDFVRCSSGNNWFNGTNNNLWGGVTNGTWTDPS